MNTTPAKTTTPDETAAAQDAAAKDTETKDAPGTSSGAGDSATATGWAPTAMVGTVSRAVLTACAVCTAL
ncbi:hypothetical protein ACWCQF_10425 [Streptomyces rubiginosohelvolus]